MSPRTAVALVALALASAASGCKSKHDDPGVSREPLARATPVVSAAGKPADPPAPIAVPAPVAKDSPATPVAPPSTKAASTETPKSADTSKSSKQDTPSSLSTAKVKRLVVTTAIENREPVASSKISLGEEPVIAFVELDNKGGDASTLQVTFEREGGKSVGHVKLEVPANKSRWRTWARTRQIRDPGTWTAVVRTASGEELAKKTFEVSGS